MLDTGCLALALCDCTKHVQGTSNPPCPQLISALTSDPHWKLVRKGTSAAFAQNNIRCGPKVSLSASATSMLISHLPFEEDYPGHDAARRIVSHLTHAQAVQQ